jgi:hypothetical protein
LNKQPKGQALETERAPQQIWMAECKNDLLAAFDAR